MGHLEILQYLKSKCLNGDYSYYTVAQIRIHFMEHPDEFVSVKNIGQNILWLQHCGAIECKKKDKVYYYRYKKDTLEQSIL